MTTKGLKYVHIYINHTDDDRLKYILKLVVVVFYVSIFNFILRVEYFIDPKQGAPRYHQH